MQQSLKFKQRATLLPLSAWHGRELELPVLLPLKGQDRDE